MAAENNSNGRSYLVRILSGILITMFYSQQVIAQEDKPVVYKHFEVTEVEGKVLKTIPVVEQSLPRWADGVSQSRKKWKKPGKTSEKPYFVAPVPFVVPPDKNSGEPFHKHNHQPSIQWLNNGDLLAIWFSTKEEAGTEMTVLASRLRSGSGEWDPASEFFKAKDRNMTGSSLFRDKNGTLYHFNSMGTSGESGWANLAVLMRISKDNGRSWTAAKPVMPEIRGRHQVISGTIKTSKGVFIQPCDAHWSSSGGTALHISTDGGKTWADPGENKPTPAFSPQQTGEGTIAGIHAGVVELKDGKLLALGRSDNIDWRMPLSISDDLGKTWKYAASPFLPIHNGQRLVLMRTNEGPILLLSFTHMPEMADKGEGMTFVDDTGKEFVGNGLFAALSYDEGKTWPVRKLVTPGSGTYDGGGWTGIFQASPTRAEPKGYLAATQTPDGVIHLISSRLYYRFNIKWIETPARSDNR
ncbi:MAG: glycoside hydrolase [Chitinophagaceae bacterium]|nr:glycoside hydrolase [Chitinophagaceae bacterium]